MDNLSATDDAACGLVNNRRSSMEMLSKTVLAQSLKFPGEHLFRRGGNAPQMNKQQSPTMSQVKSPVVASPQVTTANAAEAPPRPDDGIMKNAAAQDDDDGCADNHQCVASEGLSGASTPTKAGPAATANPSRALKKAVTFDQRRMTSVVAKSNRARLTKKTPLGVPGRMSSCTNLSLTRPSDLSREEDTEQQEAAEISHWWGNLLNESSVEGGNDAHANPSPAVVEVLLVDDSAVDRLVTGRSLKSSGFDVTCSFSGEEALALIEHRQQNNQALPSVVLMDLNMPGLSGQETASEMRGRTAGVFLPIIAISSDETILDTSNLLELFKSGFKDVVPKSSRSQFVAAIITQLNHLQDWRRAQKLARTESVLNDIIPERIARHIDVTGEYQISEHFDTVTIIFTDIVGFTSMASSCNLDELVQMLHLLFSKFDDICRTHGVYKVETIGE
eukprot:scaffold159_cov33-Prasinocladus_malaysianus.AAC.1